MTTTSAKLEDFKARAIAYLRKHGKATSVEIAEALRCARKDLVRDRLNALAAAGIIYRAGSTSADAGGAPTNIYSLDPADAKQKPVRRYNSAETTPVVEKKTRGHLRLIRLAFRKPHTDTNPTWSVLYRCECPHCDHTAEHWMVLSEWMREGGPRKACRRGSMIMSHAARKRAHEQMVSAYPRTIAPYPRDER